MKSTSQKLLLITPPFTQLNTPYPATAYIKGFLNTRDIKSVQIDLGMETTLELFSSDGLKEVFRKASSLQDNFTPNAARIFGLSQRYISTIDSVIAFLQNRDQTLAYNISQGGFLPEASKFEESEDYHWAFGQMGIRDQARHMATLYLEDLGDFIQELIDPHFGFSRYAERLGMSARKFDDIYNELKETDSHVIELMLKLLERSIENSKPSLVCISIPFPGNLFSAFKCGQWIKEHHPTIKVAIGGGYPNTELRSISDTRVFEFIDFISLDDGETPLMTLLSYLDDEIEADMMKRIFMLQEDRVVYKNGSLLTDVKQEKVGTPDYEGLPIDSYLSVIQLTNPMHRLWSDGQWNKLTMAHGCYWGKCTFCDISLDYIKNYEANSAKTIVDRMETLIDQTGQKGFHFVDEAAPPSLMKSVAIEILKRNLVVSWWTNIRFEKSFHFDLCKLLAASGCIAVSGGLEVASDRLLKLIDKGVSVEQVAQINRNFIDADIMVHAYLMYGFPSQTEQETIDSLEVVRQMFELGILQSAFWHRFAMTAHSPVGMQPAAFKVSKVSEEEGTFANNDIEYIDPSGIDHGVFSDGLKKSLYNYMHNHGLDFSLSDWFDFEIPETLHSADLIKEYLENEQSKAIKDSDKIYWIGEQVSYNIDNALLHVHSLSGVMGVECSNPLGTWIAELLNRISIIKSPSYTAVSLKSEYQEKIGNNYNDFLNSDLFFSLREMGLIFV
jgi:radical SAM superfamily enzyme YgiQ (UPF0313 family)